MFQRLHNIIYRGSERSVKAKKNIFQMFFIKGGSVLVSLLLVPMTLNYVSPEVYGLWLTLSSIVAWFSFFDIGIGNGLRNKLTEALASGNINLCRTYVSSTYIILSMIFIPLMIILLFLVPLLDWCTLLNISSHLKNDVENSLYIIIIYFCVSSILNTINIILLADQRPAEASFRSFVQNVLSLVVIFILTKTTKGNLQILCFALCAIPLFIIFVFNITLFHGRYSQISPRFSFYDNKRVPDLFKIGIQFFIIQVAGIVQFQMINFIIIRYFGAIEVSSYNISYKYFSILTLVWGIIMAPLWSAVTDAKAKSDFVWIKSIMKKSFKMALLFFVCGVMMLLVSPIVYNVWIGNSISISYVLSLFILLYNIISVFGSIYVSVLNGLSELKVQTIACIISPLVFLLCCYIFIGVMHMGVYCVVLASIIANFNAYILAPMQCNRYLKSKLKFISSNN